MRDDLLTIGELARLSGRRTSSIRYYEEIGLLPEPARRGGQRRYRQDTVRLLAVIGTAQRAGLALDEIGSLVEAMSGGDAAAVGQLRTIAAHKLPELTALIEQAELARRWLQAAARCECPSIEDCGLFSEAG